MKTPILQFKTAKRGCGGGGCSNTPHTLEVHYGFNVIEQQVPYFSITATESTHYGSWIAGGCLHDDIRRVFPELAYLIKWHCVTWGKGPMHYVANAVYWAEKIFGVSKWELESYDPDPVAAFQSTVIFGAVEGDTMPECQVVNAAGYNRVKERLITPQQARTEIKGVVEAWCKDRFDRLMVAFVRDMEQGGLVK